MTNITVSKLDIHGKEIWRYAGEVLERGQHHIVLEAYFDREDSVFHGMTLATSDRFVETYYSNRWYNIFEIHARGDDHLRGWYCNIGKPAIINGNTLSYVDLALDLLIFPDGRQIVLDEDEFASLDLPPRTRRKAHEALAELQSRFRKQYRV